LKILDMIHSGPLTFTSRVICNAKCFGATKMESRDHSLSSSWLISFSNQENQETFYVPRGLPLHGKNRFATARAKYRFSRAIQGRFEIGEARLKYGLLHATNDD